ncbi:MULTISPECIES: M35 family metallo-endopeptidase [unclassified Comamonas]|uniref:M35 family metallo-endopeptidase n=1 Tax=unclassified Comamonas TaxID=2638500 RepID=UPI0009FBC6D7|nr:M35 family metallo-endopeptidase [Comamonas sp. B-9]
MPFFKIPGPLNGIAPMRKFSRGGSINLDQSPVWHQAPQLGWHDHLLIHENYSVANIAYKKPGTHELPQDAAPRFTALGSDSLEDERFAEHIMGLIKEAIAFTEIRHSSLSRWDSEAKALTQYWFGSAEGDIRDYLLPIVSSVLRVLRGLRVEDFLPYDTAHTRLVGCSGHIDPSADAAVCPIDTMGHRILLASEFFKKDPFNRIYGTQEFLPRDSQLSILLHEITHFRDVAASNDSYYGIRNAKSISDKTNQAKINADSLAAYILGIKIK